MKSCVQTCCRRRCHCCHCRGGGGGPPPSVEVKGAGGGNSAPAGRGNISLSRHHVIWGLCLYADQAYLSFFLSYCLGFVKDCLGFQSHLLFSECAKGYGGEVGNCVACDPDKYKDIVADAQCTDCPSGTTTDGADTSTEESACGKLRFSFSRKKSIKGLSQSLREKTFTDEDLNFCLFEDSIKTDFRTTFCFSSSLVDVTTHHQKKLKKKKTSEFSELR